MVDKDWNPFIVSGELPPEEMIDRDREARDLLAHARAKQPFRLLGPRRYGPSWRVLNKRVQ